MDNKWIVHMKVCLRSFTFKNIHLNERSWIELNENERSWLKLNENARVGNGNVRQPSKKKDVGERNSI